MRILLFICLVSRAYSIDFGSTVVGGSNANIANYNYQLSLRASGSHSCGAILVGATKGVTAAHCGGGAIGTYTILAGSSDRTVTTCGTCAVRNLNSFPRHPNYSNNGNQGYPNDIATLYFASIATNANIGYGALAAANAGNFAGQNCIITGWGRTCGTCGIPNILQAGTMTVLTNADCGSRWGSASVNNGHICVLANSVASCSGDSGGPMRCGTTITGATSWGSSTCTPTAPSVYSRISFFRGWIDSN